MKIAFTDWKTMQIPDRLLIGVLAAGLAAIWLLPEIAICERICGFLAVSLPLLFLACIIPGSIGGGDVKLMAAGGFLLGIHHVWNAFAIGMLAAGIYVSLLLLTKKADRKTEIALGPFLCIGLMYSIIIV